MPISAAPDFVHEVAPILRKHCIECHSDAKKKAGLSFNSEESFLAGSEDGPVVDLKNPHKSPMLELTTSKDEDERMPPKGPGLDAKEIAVLKDWIEAGAAWEPGFLFKKPAYEPPLRPRMPELPAIVDGRANPIDRIIDAYFKDKDIERPAALDDSTFLRRVTLDLTGLLPTPEKLQAFLKNPASDKRAAAIDELLADKGAYAEHWLTFWNDLLRNDYAGTGYIDGGRTQISAWLYGALAENMPYNQFVTELVAPSEATAGFANGIKWRGSVSAAQITPMQYSQSVGQTFLGLNLKCASCHDSFVDRWKLSEAYGLAAIYSDEPLEMFRCDKPTGKTAKPGWLFPELGTIDASLPRKQRLERLAELIVDPQNGRTTRTVTNRLWQRLMGRGVVHPLDAMQSEPWNADLLDFLGSYLSAENFDLKQVLRLICNSAAYQSQTESFVPGAPATGYVFRGPIPKRLSAEEFMDAIWQVCGTAPRAFDAPVKRIESADAISASLQPKWIWSDPAPAAPKVKLVLRKTFDLETLPDWADAGISADNRFELFVNGRRIAAGDDWMKPVYVSLLPALREGKNEILLMVTNEGVSENLAGGIFHALMSGNGRTTELVSDGSWEWAAENPTQEWRRCVEMAAGTWGPTGDRVAKQIPAAISPQRMVRAGLLKSDLLMRTLGRPNREQIVSSRPEDLTTLEAMDLNNGAILDARLLEGAESLLRRNFSSTTELVSYVWRASLSRDPTADEQVVALSLLGEKPTSQTVQDFLWGIFMLPEFQIVR